MPSQAPSPPQASLSSPLSRSQQAHLPQVAIYARVSTDRQVTSQTIEQQISALHTYAQGQGWPVAAAHEYRDDGYSGARLDRPGLDRLRDAVLQGEIDLVLITSPDRLARRYAYQVWLLEEFERLGCRVIFLERPPTGDPQDALVVQIRGAVAEYERTLIADRTRRGRLAALRAGRLLPWSTPPYGYRLDPRTPRDPAGVRVEEGEAHIIRQIFSWYVEEGLNLYQIAQRLTLAHVPAPRGGAIWNTSTVRKILLNEVYCGTAYGNRWHSVPSRRRFPLVGKTPKTEGGCSYQQRPVADWIAVPVPAIVAADLFASAGERLRRNQQWAVRNTKGDYLLRQLVSCRRCGLAHSVRTGERYASYHCRGGDTLVMRRRPQACRARHIQTRLLDDLVWQDVCQVLSDPAILEAAVARAQRDWLSSDARTVRLQDLRRQQVALRAQTQRLVDAYAAGVLSLDELRERRHRVEARQRSLLHEERELEAVGAQETQLAELAGQLEQFRASVAQGLETMAFAQKRTVVELLIDRVLVDAPEVEIRYIMPLTGLAQRNGVLRARHRAAQ